ncbi:MAG: DDE-type integrase/transposase/recombinase, partial [Rhodospirillales bacterium]|nr:DDE-type integrase/transposase/recombinase [Rhodospirillales bacterium]
YVANPDRWRSRYRAAGGDAAQAVSRLNQRWEMDATPADLLLADGSRHMILGVIDVYSRRFKLHVTRTSKAAAVASLTRKAILDWGVPEMVVTDNGQEFTSRHMARVLAGLGIERRTAPPFTPEHKPFIERAFRTFSHGLVELLAGYIGHSVAERQDVEARRSLAQRIGKRGGTVALSMTAQELQAFCDRWTDTLYAREPHAGLSGRTPCDLAAAWSQPVRRIQDERALDVLLAEAPGEDGWRVVTKKGLRVDNAWFDAAELGGHEGRRVRALYDDADLGHLYVFAAEGGFLCRAVCPERTGVSRQDLAQARRARQRQVMAEQGKAMRQTARATQVSGI